MERCSPATSTAPSRARANEARVQSLATSSDSALTRTGKRLRSWSPWIRRRDGVSIDETKGARDRNEDTKRSAVFVPCTASNE